MSTATAEPTQDLKTYPPEAVFALTTIKSLIDEPYRDLVTAQCTAAKGGAPSTHLVVWVPQRCIGQALGKDGRLAMAVRTIAKAQARMEGRWFYLEVLQEGMQPQGCAEGRQ